MCEIALKTDWNLRPGSILFSGRDAEGAPAQKLQRLITVRWMKESGANVPIIPLQRQAPEIRIHLRLVEKTSTAVHFRAWAAVQWRADDRDLLAATSSRSSITAAESTFESSADVTKAPSPTSDLPFRQWSGFASEGITDAWGLRG